MSRFSSVRAVWREPLFHFLLLGMGLFVAYGWMVGSPAGEGQRVIISSGRIEQIAAGYERANGRAPLAGELQALIEDAVREEILYREAKALGLDQDDTIVRRRLRQKMEFVSEDVAPIVEATDAQLAAYLAANADKYRNETGYTLSLVYLDPDKRGDRLEGEAAQLLDKLRKSDDREGTGAGDTFLLPRRYDGLGAREMSRLFGAGFESSLRNMPVGAWQGPVKSGYGEHLVYLHDRQDAAMPLLADVRGAVRTDWMSEQRKRSNERFYADLRKRYEVTIELGAARDGAQALAEETEK